jgi:hypothetical protein
MSSSSRASAASAVAADAAGLHAVEDLAGDDDADLRRG